MGKTLKKKLIKITLRNNVILDASKFQWGYLVAAVTATKFGDSFKFNISGVWIILNSS